MVNRNETQKFLYRINQSWTAVNYNEGSRQVSGPQLSVMNRFGEKIEKAFSNFGGYDVKIHSEGSDVDILDETDEKTKKRYTYSYNVVLSVAGNRQDDVAPGAKAVETKLDGMTEDDMEVSVEETEQWNVNSVQINLGDEI